MASFNTIHKFMLSPIAGLIELDKINKQNELTMLNATQKVIDDNKNSKSLMNNWLTAPKSEEPVTDNKPIIISVVAIVVLLIIIMAIAAA